tara:strand:- start:15490 stop:15849 length:360 start_codon:yes stop_codon:yes gene_type:complete
MTQFLGRAEIFANGEKIETMPGATLDVGGVKNNTVIVGGTVGRSEELVPAAITCTTMLGVGQSLEILRNLKDATVIFKCDTGQSYVSRNAFRTDTTTLKDGGGGEVTISINGDPAEELA